MSISLLNKCWHCRTASEVADLLSTDAAGGLDVLEVRARQNEFGPNRISRGRHKTFVERFLLQFHQPLIYILILAGVVTAILGEWVDSSVILAVVLVNALIGFLQEAKAVRALAALDSAMATETEVIRAGKASRIPAEDLVPGDLVRVRSGDKIPADLRLVFQRELRIDESALTGESVPAEKSMDPVDSRALLGDRTCMAYASTLVAKGQGMGLVTATGDSTEIGRISALIKEADDLQTPLTRKIAAFSHFLLYAIGFLAVVAFAAGILRGEPAREMFMAAVALAVGAIPEGLPAAVTVILAIGVSRMAARRAVIRKLPAVETLGGTTVICSDKTGTLTQNQMTVQSLFVGSSRYEVRGTGYQPSGSIVPRDQAPSHTPALEQLLVCGLLCNDSQIVLKDGAYAAQGDPTEAALIVSAAKYGLEREKCEKAYPRVDSLPFESEYQYMATLHEVGGKKTAYVKGAVDRLLDRCAAAMNNDGAKAELDRQAVLEHMESMAERGERVLALAMKEFPGQKTSVEHRDLQADMVFLGLQGMIDPPRDEAVAAVKSCRQAGIAVKMITGDHAVTARAVGRQLGLENVEEDGPSSVLTGREIEVMPDEDLVAAVREVPVFARVSPEQKLRLVRAVQAGGDVVAMTGDGVNDAPALRQADIGVAMGLGGTDAAQEAADMILTDDNFATIESAVEEGRGVFDNLIKFIVWTLPTNIGEGLVILTAILLGTTLPILPVQILWINMTTAGVLGLMLAFEDKEPGIMTRPPRDPARPILSSCLVLRIIMVSLILLAASFAMFKFELSLGNSLEEARTVAVNVFVLLEAAYLLNTRSFTRNPLSLGLMSNIWVPVGIVGMLCLQMVFIYAPFMQTMFKTAPIGFRQWAQTLAAAVALFVVVEMEKKIRLRMEAKKAGLSAPAC